MTTLTIFHTWCFPFAPICHWISIVFLLYGRRIATHSVDPSLTHFLGEFPGLVLALIPDVVVPVARFHTPSMESEENGDGHQYGRRPSTPEPIPIAGKLT